MHRLDFIRVTVSQIPRMCGVLDGREFLDGYARATSLRLAPRWQRECEAKREILVVRVDQEGD